MIDHKLKLKTNLLPDSNCIKYTDLYNTHYRIYININIYIVNLTNFIIYISLYTNIKLIYLNIDIVGI